MVKVDAEKELKEDQDFFKKQSRYSKKELSHFRDMKVLILSPIFVPEAKWVKCLANMIALSWYFGLQIEKMAVAEKMVVDWARNALVTQALDDRSYIDNKPFTHFLWLDCDHTFDPDMALHLAKHDVEAVSALYYSRTGDILPVAFMPNPKDSDGYKHYPILEIPPILWEVGAFGFGACLIKREVFEKTPGPFWFTLDYRCGEDFAFCREARKHGVKFHVDGSYKIGHIAPGPIITEKEAKEFRVAHPDFDKDRVQIKQGENL